MFYKLILLALTLAASHAAVLQHGILAASDTTGTNATVRSVTITGQTNLNAGVLNATNDLKRAGVTIFNTTATVIPALNASGTFIDSAFSFVPDGTDGVINLFTDTDNDTADTAMIVQPYSTSAYGNAHIALIVENNVETPASTTFPVNAAREGNNAIYGLSAAPNTNTVAVGVIGAVDPAKFNYSIGVEGIVEVATSHAASTNFGVVASADLPASDASRKTMPLFARAFRTASPDVPVAENAILLLDSYDTGYPLIIARTNNGTTAFKVEAASGYAGGGTLFLSDDGTYKAAGGGAIANTVLGSGTTAANDIAVFTDTTHTNIARSTSEANLGDSSATSFLLQSGLSGSTDSGIRFTNSAILLTNASVLFGTDNTHDIGGSSTVNRPRTLYVGTSVVAPSSLLINGTGFRSPTAGYFYWLGRCAMTSPADGVIRLTDTAETSFDRLQFGGTSSSFPSIKRSGTGLALRLADDSGNAQLTLGGPNDTTALTVNAGSVTGSGTTPAVILSGTLNTSGVVDGMVQIKATNTASGAASKLFSILSGAAGATAAFSVAPDGNVLSSGRYEAASGSPYRWTGTSAIYSTIDGQINMANSSVNSFTRLVLGWDDSSPNSATLRAASGVGTDIAGGGTIIAGGQSTGTGRGGPVIFQTSTNQATGSTANGYTVRGQYPAKAVTLTDTVATTVVTIPVPQSGFVGGECVVTVFATDGTDFQTRTLTFPFSAVNKAGTVTANAGTPVESVSASTGTLTATVAGVNSGANLNIQVTADTSFGSTTIFTATVALPVINSNGPATVTEI
jgi:hypothetical protein